MTDKAEKSGVKGFCRCSRCGTVLHIENWELIKDFPESEDLVVKFMVSPHLCSEYVDDNGTRMKQIKDHNDALQKRNTELVEENRKLAAKIKHSSRSMVNGGKAND